MKTKTARPPLPIGSPVSYGLPMGHAPCTVTELDPATGLPSVLTVAETLPHCKKGARITLDASFWDAMPDTADFREIRPGVWFAPYRRARA